MKLYTKFGDDGGTALFDGARVLKCDGRVASYGEVDELNAHIGLAVAMLSERHAAPSSPQALVSAVALMIERLTEIQHALFSIGAELATPMESPQRGHVREMTAAMASRLEGWIDEASGAAPEIRAFVLPGGDVCAAQLHVCRTVCRRAERAVVALMQTERLNGQVVVYLNRLSDLLFAWARQVNHVTGAGDVEWRNAKSGM